jgi:hypothetical protein
MVYTSVGHLFDFSNNCQLQVIDLFKFQKNAIFGSLKFSISKNWPVSIV